MEVTMNYFGQLRHHAGREHESLKVSDGVGLLTLLQKAAAMHGPDFTNILLDEHGNVRPSVMLLINGAPADKANPPVLADGDAVSVLPAISGG